MAGEILVDRRENDAESAAPGNAGTPEVLARPDAGRGLSAARRRALPANFVQVSRGPSLVGPSRNVRRRADAPLVAHASQAPTMPVGVWETLPLAWRRISLARREDPKMTSRVSMAGLQGPPGPAQLIPTEDPASFDRSDAEHRTAWGFADTSFVVDERGIVRLSGDRYELCGADLPDLMPFAQEVLGVEVDVRDVFEPQSPAALEPSRANASLLTSLREVLAEDQITTDEAARRRHGHGHTQEEVYALRYGRLARTPDVVVFPGSEEEVVDIVRVAVAAGACLIPYGGGTNVTEALRCPEDEARPIVSVDMKRMSRILWIDEGSRLACIEAGAVGRHLVRALASRGLTLGHEPDSIEFSTLGGWIATRSSGMKKNRYGNIEDLVLDIRMVTPAGVLGGRAPNPRESVGPDGRHVMLGSEGSLGIITSAVVKISPLPEVERYGSILFKDLDAGVAFLRDVSAEGDLPASVRVVDNLQFRFGLSLKPKTEGTKRLKSLIERWIVTRVKGFQGDKLVACTIVYEGSRAQVERQEKAIKLLASHHGGLPAGAANGRRGYQLTFGIAYIRDFLMKYYVLAESFETSVPWACLTKMCANVRRRVEEEHAKRGLPGKPFLSLRVTQVYDTGVCVYFYLAYYFKGVLNPSRVYAELENAAREEILAAGGSLSHHHGVGKIRRSFLPQVRSPLSISLVAAAKKALDPTDVFGARNNAFGLVSRDRGP
jgi:alkyldihydroxyacetonephosphate synthase